MDEMGTPALVEIAESTNPAPGPVAPNGRAAALQAAGSGFESPWVHSVPVAGSDGRSPSTLRCNEGRAATAWWL